MTCAVEVIFVLLLGAATVRGMLCLIGAVLGGATERDKHLRRFYWYAVMVVGMLIAFYAGRHP